MRKQTQELSRYQQKQAVNNAALQLDAESDIFRPEEEAGLSAQQWQAIALLVAGKKGVDVAQGIGVTPETVSRWRGNPLFAAAFNCELRDTYAATIGAVRGLKEDAIEALRQCLYSEDDKTRMSAALAVLRLHLQLDSGALSLPTTPAQVAGAQQQKALLDSLFI